MVIVSFFFTVSSLRKANIYVYVERKEYTYTEEGAQSLLRPPPGLHKGQPDG